MTKKKKWIFAITGVFLFVGILYTPLGSWMGYWAARSIVFAYWGSTLDYDKIYWENGQLVIENPVLYSPNEIKADRLKIAGRINLHQPALALDLHIEKPHCTLCPDDYAALYSLLNASGKTKYLNKRLHINNGVIEWLSEGQEPFRSTLSLSQHDDKLIAAASFKDTSFPSLVNLLQNIDPSLETWEVSSGSISGDITMEIPSHQEPTIVGSLHITRVSVNNFSSEISGVFASIDVEMSPELVTVSFPDAATISSYHHEVPQWQLDDFKGLISLSNLADAHMKLQTTATHQGRQLLFNIVGDMKIEDHYPSELEITLSCDSMELPASLVNFTANANSMKLDCHHLSAIESRFLQSILRTFWSRADDIEMESGFLDGSLKLLFNSQGAHKLIVDSFSGTFLRIKSEVMKLSAHFPHIRGSGHIDLSAEKPLETLDAEVDVKDAMVDMHERISAFPIISGIETQLKLRHGQFQKSTAKLEIGTLRGTVDIASESESPIMSLTMEGKAIELAGLFPDKFQQILMETFGSYRMGVNATIFDNEIKGVIHLGAEGEISKDLIHFGSGLSLKPKGWFYAQQLPIEKYISPYIFPTKVAKLNGIGEFRGSFDSQAVIIRYDVDNLVLENEHVKMQRPSLTDQKQRRLLGYHCFNFSDGSSYGHMPVENGSYFEKHHGLEFSGISSQVHFEEGKVHLSAVEAYCGGIYLSGSIDFDYSDPAPGVFDVTAELSQFHGTVSQAQHFFSHLHTPGLLEKLPLEGEISARAEGAQISFEFSPEEDIIHTTAHAVLNNGTADFPSIHASLRDLSMNIDYNHDLDTLQFNDLQGTGLVGHGRNPKEYLISGGHIRFAHFKDQEFSMDITLKEGNDEVARLAGESKPDSDGSLTFKMNGPLTHMGNIHPDILEATLSQDGEIKDWAFTLKFPLSPFFNYLKRFEDSGWLFLSKRVLQQGSYLQLGGALFDVKLGYHGGIFEYEFLGRDISFYNALFNQFLLRGKKLEKRWVVDELSLDKLHLSTEISPKDDEWKIHFLGLKYGQNLLMGLDGEWNKATNVLSAQINLFEWNLQDDELLKDWMETVQPIGSLKGTGDLSIAFMSEAPWIKYHSSIKSEIAGWRMGKLFLHQERPFVIQVDSEKGVGFEDVEVSLRDSNNILGTGCCEKLNFALGKGSWQLENMHFNIPHRSVAALGNQLQKEFPDYINDKVKDKLLSVKNDDLSGTLSYKKDNDLFYAALQLTDGVYSIKGKELTLQGPRIEWEPHSISLSAQSSYGRYPYYIQSHFKWPELNGGDCVVTDLSLSHEGMPLHVEWQADPMGTIHVQSISGSCAGINCALKSNLSGLEGKVEIDVDRAIPLLGADFAAQISKIGLGPRYLLDGRWQIQCSEDKKLEESIYYQGKLTSNSTTFKGYEFDKFEADVEGSPQQIKFENICLRDVAGTVQCPQMTVSRNSDHETWSAWIPSLVLKDIRPTLLKEKGAVERQPGKARSLLVKRVELNDFYGRLSDTSTWQGSGMLHFCNPTRKNLQHPLFAIPAELILRLGLDPQVLNPVTGNIYFNLKGDKFYLTKFKDVFSEGRGSRFFLDPQADPSWVGLDGQLSVHVRMKQYNLIFKIAELFSVSIQGNLTKPKYSLEKAQ